ncbi:MFS domain-containing protein [Fusarium falciforme]|nr:MFS domain-containing protein [Fusarium falciforme]WAO86088.1 MFS domain-containing protein [Fusarium falciforme]
MVVYVGFLAAGSALGPIIAGAVAHGVGDWRWYQRILAIAVAVNLLGSIFMLPETTHDSMGMSGPAMVEDGDTDSKAEATANEFASGSGQEPNPPDDGSLSQTLRKEWVKRSFSAHYVTMDWKAALLAFVRPLQLIALPQVVVTTLVFGLTIGWTVIIAVILAVVYAPPPLLWSSLHVGLLSLAPLTGLLIGLPVGGALADMLFNRHDKKSQEVHDPAVRLPAVIIGGLVSPAGCLVLGYGLQHPHTWIQVCVGWAMLAFGLTGSANVLLTYAVDSLPVRAGDIGTLLNVTKNSLGFGVSYASVSWMQKSGTASQFATMAGLLWFCYLLVIPLWLYRAALVRLMTRWY